MNICDGAAQNMSIILYFPNQFHSMCSLKYLVFIYLLLVLQ